MIDHIVYTVFDLDEAMTWFEQKLGVRPIFGGYHESFGTKNALINLNDGMYLELLAADPQNTEVTTPRWMGVDLLRKNQITRWAIKSKDLQVTSPILKKYNAAMGKIQEGSRNLTDGNRLKWQLTVPLAAPEIEHVPFAIDWSTSDKHPTEMLPPMNCHLVNFYGTHSANEKINDVLQELQCDFQIKKGAESSLKLVIDCPNGIIEI